jgi:hypothetical protein
MNGDVERLLCGNNTFQFRNGVIVNDVNKGTKETIELRLRIKHALQKHILESDLHEADI